MVSIEKEMDGEGRQMKRLHNFSNGQAIRKDHGAPPPAPLRLSGITPLINAC